MKKIDPENPKILELSQQTDVLLQLDVLYENALLQIKEGKDAEALVILQNIESKYPGFRDVKQLIIGTETRIDVAQALAQATEAYKESRWADARAGSQVSWLGRS